MTYSLSISNKEISKRDLLKLAREMAENSQNPLEAIILAHKLETMAKAIKATLSPVVLEKIGDEAITAIGANVTWAGGGHVSSGEKSFGHNPAWVEAVARVKEIEGSMKAAAKNKFSVSIDSETGEEIPPAKPQPRKPYLKITY